MRTLYVFNMISLDGFFEGSDQDIGWHTVDDEFNVFAGEQLNNTDTIVFGRVTYEGMASYWPTPLAIENDPVIAGRMNAISKIVVSRTLDKADWNNTRLITDNVAQEIMKFKRQPGKDIAVFGSAKLTTSLLHMGLVDELRIMVSPLVLGRGTPPFHNVDAPIKLKLIKTRIFGNGNVLMTYQPQTS